MNQPAGNASRSLFQRTNNEGNATLAENTAAAILGSRTHQYPGKLLVSETFFQVPIDYKNHELGTLRIFGRTVERYIKPVDRSKPSHDEKLPLFLYLQGGPGFPCRSPTDIGWVNIVLDKGYKIVLMDQRGTGMSSTVTAHTLMSQGNATKQAEYLTHFRADNIVQDSEAIRKCLTKDYPPEKKKWSVMGQSFGGFCAVHYLSRFPDGLQEVFLTGGLPPLVKSPDSVYPRLFGRVLERNRLYYRKFPEDRDRIKKIVRHLQNESIALPSGGRMSALRFRQLGYLFGFHGWMETIHELIMRLYNDFTYLGFFTRQALSTFERMQPFDNAPLYALVHEAIYAERHATRWSADRIMKSIPEFANIDPQRDTPILFVGEMIFRDMFKDYAELDGLQEVADLLASYNGWPELYDEAQLANNDVDVYAAIYIEDMYVDFDLARDTASKIRKCKSFITNIMYHDALGSKADEVMKRLFDLRDDMID